MRKVKLRTKKISNGRKCLYFDVYPPVQDLVKLMRKYYLKLFIYETPTSFIGKQHNKKVLYLAEIIRAKCQISLQALNQYWEF